MNKASNIAIVGATGLVGKTFLELLESDHFLDSKIHLVASSKSKGQEVFFRNSVHVVNSLEEFNFSEVDVVFFSAGDKVAKKYAPKAQKEGCFVVDNSSCFRQDESIPLIVPEVNSEDFTETSIPGIVANPNCSTIQMVVALKPLHDLFVINRIDVTTFQAVSGTGKLAQDELTNQIKDQMSGATPSSQIYSKQIAFNVLPHCQDFESNGFTREEMKIVWETHRILDPNIEIAATCVRVPVLNGHSESVHIETRESLNVDAVKECLSEAKGVKLIRGEGSESYTTALEVDGTDLVHVGRVRIDLWNKNRVNLWIVADNLRKGAALNSIQIAEIHFS
ncbi:MAG: aspartate-semialdehyde dehydrogenase [SAR86 cluster bacterium]|jgi:aspartate-semialdehyde dehydrogenase|nr:aspartate-semialdehyde dehydrogenase [SAR86 cluster bacterium]